MTGYPQATCFEIFSQIEATFLLCRRRRRPNQEGRGSTRWRGLAPTTPPGKIVPIGLLTKKKPRCRFLIVPKQQKPIKFSKIFGRVKGTIDPNLPRYSSNNFHYYFDKQENYKKIDKTGGDISQRYCMRKSCKNRQLGVSHITNYSLEHMLEV